MSLRKKDIVKNISTKAQISTADSSVFLKHFLDFIKLNRNRHIKIHNFGNFNTVHTPERLGRNPMTKEIYKIQARKKLKFTTSNKIKNTLN